MSRIPNNLQVGDRIQIFMDTGEVDVVLFNGWVWHKGLPPAMRFVKEPYQEGDSLVEESGWIARKMIARIRRLDKVGNT